MKPAASRRDVVVGAIMIVAAIAYLIGFVPLGWVAHDEGMLGQTADRVLHGEIPHVDFDEPYTGGLTWLYAGVFKVAGVDLLYVRWLLFAAAAWTAWLTYAILRRFLRPIAAALATWVAIGWSFPNYFAGLPSWWLLLCALLCVWAVVRHAETEDRRWLIVAGLSAGLAVTIKQTGVYLLAALVFTVSYDGGRPLAASAASAALERVTRWGACLVAVVSVALILGPRLLKAEGLYLLVPIAACAAVLVTRRTSQAETPAAHSPLPSLAIALFAAALPLVLLLLPYFSAERLRDLFNGLFVLPRKRLVFAYASMPTAWTILTGTPLLALVFVRRCRDWAAESKTAGVLLWIAAILLPALALQFSVSYQAVWQSTRAFAAMAPVGICALLRSKDAGHAPRRTILFVLAATLAWMSLNQFPFAAPIYFSYVTPLAVIAAVAATSTHTRFLRQTMMPWAIMLLLFAVLVTNRGDLNMLGVAHVVRPPAARLNLPRAHLMVSQSEVDMYRRLVFTLRARLQDGRLIAGPDCPEVYFLLGLFSPSGELFDFLSAPSTSPQADFAEWSKGDCVVVNLDPRFSPRPTERLLASLRREFPFGQQIGRFEVRWR